MTSEPKITAKPMAVVTIAAAECVYTVPCTPINDWLAITPDLGTDEAGNVQLMGTFSITHRPSGRRFSEGGGCINCCHRAAKELRALAIDWAALDFTDTAPWVASLDDDTKRLLQVARSLEWACDADYCDVSAVIPDDE